MQWLLSIDKNPVRAIGLVATLLVALLGWTLLVVSAFSTAPTT